MSLRLRTAFLAAFFMGFFAAACRQSSEVSVDKMSAPRVLYHCPMHPEFTSEDPKASCGLCGMALVPTDNKDMQGGAVQLPNDRAQLIGVAVSTVEKRRLMKTVQAAARVVADPYFSATVMEFQNAVPPSTTPSNYQQDAQARYNSAAVRLQQIGVDTKRIAKRIDSSLTLQRPDEIAWVHAEIFDYESSLISPEQWVDLRSTAYPGRVFRGQVIAIDGALTKDTHAVRVRIGVNNHDGALKPEMVLTGSFHATMGERLAIPSSAVMDTGVRQVVFVNTADGVYDPRDVRVGNEADGYVEVLKGLSVGEHVVTSANFFLDSESKLRAH